MTGITILGATGTVGLNTLAVLKQHPREFEVIALTANRDVQQLASLCIEWCPRYAVMADPLSAQLLQHHLKAINSEVTVLSGVDGLIQVASLPEVNMVMAAIVGSAGLLPTLAAAQAGKRILLANKEALVMSGQLFMDTVQQHQAELLPIDSEHNAIFQCLPIHFRTLITEESLKKPNSTAGRLANIGVKRIVLTASGGPFRTMNPTDLHEVTPEQACAHPNWKMGRKISVDSATMMNKGLEIIEACWLFATIPDRIQVVLHPQSIIHSLVEYVDGSMLAQLSHPDMRIPIAHALAWPQRMISGIDSINLAEIGRLEFEPLDFNRFPCLRLAYEAMLAGGTTTTILNAANEIAVQAFLQGQIRFTDIHQVIETTLSLLSGREATQLDIILEDDAKARELALEITLKMQ